MGRQQASKPIRRPVQIPIELHSVLKMEAARRDVPMGELIREAMDGYLVSSPRKRKKVKASA